MAGVVAAAATAAVTGYLTTAFDKTLSTVTGADAAPPLTWTTTVNRDPCENATSRYVLPILPRRPAEEGGISESQERDALDGGYTDAVVTVQGKSGVAVVLHALRVEVVQRGAPAGVAVPKNRQCGAITPRNFVVDLDEREPHSRPFAGVDDNGDEQSAVRFPFRVSDGDPEVFHVYGATRTCDCRWRILLDWSSQDKKGTAVIDAGGRLFRTVGVKDLPGYDVASAGDSKYRWRRGGPPLDPLPLRE
ncbi:hypothetical protein [Sphaerisporangium rhizosphaerae]|uniref:hypothetical protein n=1 Tax=Sphaerisporangium rhizosphaerae TaxID=2269375 RepID=UPI0036D249FB